MVLKSSDILLYREAVAGLAAELDGSYVIESYDLAGNLLRGRRLAEQVRASNAKVVIAVGLKAALAAQLEIADVPVIYCMVFDPARHHLNASNFTGVTLDIPPDKQLKTIRQFLPQVKRLGVLFDPAQTAGVVAEAKRAAQKAGLEVIDSPVTSQKQVPGALRQLVATIDAVWVLPDSTVLSDEEALRFIVATALDQGKPVIGFSPDFARHGALLAMSVAPNDIGRQVGRLAQRILKRELAPSGATMPPERLRSAVNRGSAQFLGIVLPPELLGRADEVF